MSSLTIFCRIDDQWWSSSLDLFVESTEQATIEWVISLDDSTAKDDTSASGDVFRCLPHQCCRSLISVMQSNSHTHRQCFQSEGKTEMIREWTGKEERNWMRKLYSTTNKSDSKAVEINKWSERKKRSKWEREKKRTYLLSLCVTAEHLSIVLRPVPPTKLPTAVCRKRNGNKILVRANWHKAFDRCDSYIEMETISSFSQRGSSLIAKSSLLIIETTVQLKSPSIISVCFVVLLLLFYYFEIN